jgi:serine/threonine protein kinase/Flp pilus assembly protein TadD
VKFFVAAVGKLAPEQWDTYLAEACAGDVELIRRVKRLLQLDAGAGSFLESPASALLATVDAPIAERPGTVLGPYKLMEQIGEGGMGLVFVAEQQQPIRRKVALKVIKPGMDTRAVIARFEAERQALALMDHPHIAKVLDAGATDSGRPYFVMELVKGVPITDYCDQNQLTTRQRLELMLTVCQAIQHAHQKGIIHRDIKPSNVLVMSHDGMPVVRVIDFGVAKAIGQRLSDKTVYTQFTQMIGTPLYMSPEQAGESSLDVDTRSDIYSLGVLLYELLTGTTPFDKERFSRVGFDEIRRIIREEEPPKPSTRISTLGQAATTLSTQRQSDPKRLSQLIRGELDWIVMKCLEKDRNRRYDTANSLAKDIERYLQDEPVQACPPSFAYRLRKFIRRNRTVVAAVASVVGLLLLAVLGLAVSNIRIAQEKAVAEANFRKAREAVDEQFTLVSQSKLFDTPGLQALRKDLLESALKYYEEFLRQRPDDPILQVEVAAAYFRLYELYENFDSGKSAESLHAFEKGLTIVEDLLRDHTEDPGLYRRLAGFAKGGRLLHSVYSGRGPRADTVRSIDLLARAIPIWEQFVRDDPAVIGFQMDLSALHYASCELLDVAGRREEALASAQKALALREQVVRADPNVPEYRAELAFTHDLLAWQLGQAGSPEEAETHTRQSLDLRRRLVEEHPDVPEYRAALAASHHNLGSWLAESGRLAEARQHYQEGLLVQEKLVTEFPDMPHFRGWLARYNDSLGHVLRWSGRTDEAEQAYRRALAEWEKLAAAFPAIAGYQTSSTYSAHSLCLLLAAAGRRQEAEPFFRRIVQFKPQSPEELNQTAWLLVAHPAPPFRDLSRAVELAKKAVGWEPSAGPYWNTLGLAHYRAGNWKDAVTALERSVKSGGGDSWDWFFLAMSYWRLGDKEQARKFYGQAIQWMEQHQTGNVGLHQELRSFRAEAAGLLGFKDQPPTKEKETTDAKAPSRKAP